MKSSLLSLAMTAALALYSMPSAPAAELTCPPGEHRVRAHPRKGTIRADGIPVRGTDVSQSCHPNPPSYAKWHERLRDKPSQHWIRRKEKPRAWTDEEREKVYEALSSLPAALLLDSVKAVYRLAKSSEYDRNPGSGVSGEIAVYDSAFESKQDLARILAHEFAHELYRHTPDPEKDEYRKAADWILYRLSPRPGDFRLTPNRDPDAYVKDDGTENLTEDFANNIEYFLFNPEILRQKTPKVYQ